MRVPYNYLGSFLLNGCEPLFLSVFDHEEDREFRFSDFVYCNIHMPILIQLRQRDMYSFWATGKYLEGDTSFEQECAKTLKYFYSDMADTLAAMLKYKPTSTGKVDIVTDIYDLTNYTVKTFVKSKVLEDISFILENSEERDNSSVGPDFLSRFTNSEIDRLVPTDALCSLATLAYTLSFDERVVMEVI